MGCSFQLLPQALGAREVTNKQNAIKLYLMASG